jgi:thiol:disulfide interchange protein DsbD
MRFLPLLFIILSKSFVFGQVETPAKWQTSTSTSSANIGEELDLIFTAAIDNSWYLYSSEFDCEDGPIKTTFTFTPDASYNC